MADVIRLAGLAPLVCMVLLMSIFGLDAFTISYWTTSADSDYPNRSSPISQLMNGRFSKSFEDPSPTRVCGLGAGFSQTACNKQCQLQGGTECSSVLDSEGQLIDYCCEFDD